MKTHLIIFVLVSLFCTGLHAQTSGLPVQEQTIGGWKSKSWQTSAFKGVVFNQGWYSSGSFSSLSAPMGLQLTHRINNNLYAFGRVSVAPTFFSFNSAFTNPGFNKGYPGNTLFNNSRFGVFPRAEAGLFYINDQKTFSISGSMFIDRRSNYYPVYGAGGFPAGLLR